MGKELDGNFMKRMSNGGSDMLVARFHGSNETSFKISFLPILFCNDIDKIKPMDDAIRTRLECINYEKMYFLDCKRVLYNQNFSFKIFIF